jgi:hypothetical protein
MKAFTEKLKNAEIVFFCLPLSIEAVVDEFEAVIPGSTPLQPASSGGYWLRSNVRGRAAK